MGTLLINGFISFLKKNNCKEKYFCFLIEGNFTRDDIF